jgi:GT2 family glycosyltransferase
VVDNGSTDSTPLLVGDFPEATLLRQDANVGFGRANNIGIGVALRAKADGVFLLNQDARVDRDSIRELVQCALDNPEYGILSPIHLDGTGSDFDAGFAQYLLRAGQTLLFDMFRMQMQDIYATSFVNAAAWLVTSECLNAVGGFDPLFFMYGEDYDYCNRARWHGFAVGIVPKSIIFHDRARASDPRNMHQSGLGMRIRRNLAQMLATFMNPEGSFLQRLAALTGMSTKMGIRLLSRGDFEGCLGTIPAYLMAAVQTPAVWKHRRKNRSTGKHWLGETEVPGALR